MVAAGLVWAFDHREWTSKFYARVMRGWDMVPGFGPAYKKLVPLGQFRYGGAIVIILMGLILSVIGVGSLLIP